MKICLIGTPLLNKSSISNMAPVLTSRELENRIQEYSDSLDEVIVITHTLQINTIESEHLWKAGWNEALKELKKFTSKISKYLMIGNQSKKNLLKFLYNLIMI